MDVCLLQLSMKTVGHPKPLTTDAFLNLLTERELNFREGYNGPIKEIDAVAFQAANLSRKSLEKMRDLGSLWHKWPANPLSL